MVVCDQLLRISIYIRRSLLCNIRKSLSAPNRFLDLANNMTQEKRPSQLVRQLTEPFSTKEEAVTRMLSCHIPVSKGSSTWQAVNVSPSSSKWATFVNPVIPCSVDIRDGIDRSVIPIRERLSHCRENFLSRYAKTEEEISQWIQAGPCQDTTHKFFSVLRFSIFDRDIGQSGKSYGITVNVLAPRPVRRFQRI